MNSQETQILGMIGDMKGELGELRGQLRELAHGVNNLIVQVSAISRTTSENHSIPTDIAKLEGRILALEIIEQQRTGAVKLGTAFVKSPFLGWAAAIISTAISGYFIFIGN